MRPTSPIRFYSIAVPEFAPEIRHRGHTNPPKKVKWTDTALAHLIELVAPGNEVTLDRSQGRIRAKERSSRPPSQVRLGFQGFYKLLKAYVKQFSSLADLTGRPLFRSCAYNVCGKLSNLKVILY